MGNYIVRCFMCDLLIFKLRLFRGWNRRPDGGKSNTHADLKRHEVAGSYMAVFYDDFVLVEMYLSWTEVGDRTDGIGYKSDLEAASRRPNVCRDIPGVGCSNQTVPFVD